MADAGHELPARVLEWRQLAKLKSTYADALVEEINPATGRVHTSYAMAATSTGRISSNDPNLQNIPIRTEEGARIRRVFVAEPGHVLISADYSQIELRLLAHVADIAPRCARRSPPARISTPARPAKCSAFPLAQMDGVTRRRAKAINFGIIYGISAFGLARQLGIEAGEAKSYIDAYFHPLSRHSRLHGAHQGRSAHQRLCADTVRPALLDTGHRRSSNMARRAGAERQAINAPLQGGGADIMKRAMVRLPAALREAALSARLLLTVHDELLFEAHEDEAEALAGVARRIMEGAAVLSVPLVVETGVGKSWGEAH